MHISLLRQHLLKFSRSELSFSNFSFQFIAMGYTRSQSVKTFNLCNALYNLVSFLQIKVKLSITFSKVAR